MMQVSGLSRVFNNLNVSIMKRLKYLALAFIAIGFVSCEDNFTEEPTPVGPEGNLEKMTITLEAGKGASEADETRVYLGTFGSTVTYYWENTDKVGMYALTNTSTMENFEAAINELNSNKNLARFQGDIYATGKGAQDLFIYWPYNSSNMVANKTAVNYLKETGVAITTLAQQTQYGYNITDGAEDHPSVKGINAYGAAVDLITTDDTGVGAFELQHQTAYLQFELYGENTEGQHAFADGGYKVKGMRVELGKFDGTVSGKNSKLEGTFTPVAIAGNYRYGLLSDYTYSKNNVSRKDVVVKSTGTATVVSVTLAEERELKDQSQKLPVLAVVNPALVTKENVNCIRAVVQLVNETGTEYVERTRYIDLRSLDALKGGDYYKISYKVVDPAEASAQLDANGHSNCYIVSYPGTYTFNVNIPGNGIVPFGASASDLGLELNENGKFFEASEATNYEVNWLWASGTSFEAANGDVESVVTVELNGESGVLVVKPQATNLSGNLVVALYEDTNDSGVCDNGETITWSWHIWFGAPKDQYFNFPVTRPYNESESGSYKITNEHWYMLDRNIGAESNELNYVRSFGLYYQYGRKDPFVGPGTYDGAWASLTSYANTKIFGTDIATWTSGKSFDYTTAYKYPMHLTSGAAHGYGWVSSDEVDAANTKTLYDPCPLGYKLPTTREWDNFSDIEFKASTPTTENSGPFGYSTYKDYVRGNSSYYNSYSDEADAAFVERIAAGNYYTINDKSERTYVVKDLSGTGEAINVNLPNAGVIRYNGTIEGVGENFALWAAGRLESDSFVYDWYGMYNGPWHDIRSLPYAFTGTSGNSGYITDSKYYFIATVATGSIGGRQATTAAPARCIKEYNDNAE